MGTDSLQQELFKQIRTLLPANLSLADEVAELLDISADSAYRRIRGEKLISFEELRTLAVHFRISLDAVLKIDSRSTVFYGQFLNADNFNPETYLITLKENLEQIARCEHKEIYYEAKDFPPFHYFHFPQLACFKFFFWMKTIYNHPDYSKMAFEENVLLQTIEQLGAQVLKVYNKLPTTEIWSLETINSTIHQIEYYREAGIIRKQETYAQLLDQLSAMVDHVKDQADCGEKLALGQKAYGGPTFRLYLNEAYLGHNTIMTVCDGHEKVYINHGVLNQMMTPDKDFCENTRRYFDNTMKKSALISAANEKERNRFFNAMQDKISRVKASHSGVSAGL